MSRAMGVMPNRYDGVENALKMARNESQERYISPLKNLNEGITM